MIPWPVAFLAIFYAVLATSSAAILWQAGHGQLQRSLLWPGLWCGLSTLLVLGLALLKPWARKLAIWTSIVMMLGSLGVAGSAIVQANPEPIRSLIATGIASAQLVVIRYLCRPAVKAWFQTGTVNNRSMDYRPSTID